MDTAISIATARNWARLNTDISQRLTTRANKRHSMQTFLPLEYFSDENNISTIEEIVKYILNNKIDIFSAIYSIAINKLVTANIYNLSHVQKTLSDYHIVPNDYLLNMKYPSNERDLLGLIYQSISLEGEKNKKGSYYTPHKVVQNMLSCVYLEKEKTLLDPCCGSGSFLMSVEANPQQIYGVDNDEIAVFICKINLLLKYQNEQFIPQIYCLDFLNSDIFSSTHPIFNTKFDYITTNPPWGAMCNMYPVCEIFSKESFSYFFVKSFELLKPNGTIRFLFPESILNVKVHKDIRQYMLTHGTIASITLYDGMFSGVATRYVDIEVINKFTDYGTVNIYSSTGITCVNLQNFYNTENLVFNFSNSIDAEIISLVKRKGVYSLKDSIWALGIVTGDNKGKLLSKATTETEPIYTGKEISAYCLKEPKKFIVYKRDNFQQVAKEEYYRADEKLVYKFISNKLVFAYDNTQALFLNSANILIPCIPNMSIKTVLAFLNSELYQYLYNTLFTEIKILKGNLLELPFPCISSEINQKVTLLVERILQGKTEYIAQVENLIYEIFGINDSKKTHIKEKLNGKVD